MRTLLSFVAMLLVIFGAVYVLGNILPVEHTTEVTKVIDACDRLFKKTYAAARAEDDNLPLK